jgi:hypothetical protein
MKVTKEPTLQTVDEREEEDKMDEESVRLGPDEEEEDDD